MPSFEHRNGLSCAEIEDEVDDYGAATDRFRRFAGWIVSEDHRNTMSFEDAWGQAVERAKELLGS